MLAQLSWRKARKWGGWCRGALATGSLVAVMGMPGLGGVGVALGQCEMMWQEGEGVAGVVAKLNDPTSYPSSLVRGLATWDPDGAGPASEVLVAGGQFKVAGDRVVGHIAAWDGAAWTAIGSIEEFVGDVCVLDGMLVAGTYPDPNVCCNPIPTANRVLAWTGAAWTPLGGVGQDGVVYEVHVHEGEIIAAGGFKHCDEQVVNSIIRWDGLQWQPLGNGIGSKTLPAQFGGVYSLESFGDDLIAAGSFKEAAGFPGNGIARWDGADWSALGKGLDGDVRAIASVNGSLVVGGYFGSSGSVSVNRLALWSGTEWQEFAPGHGAYVIRSLMNHQGGLYAGGDFGSKPDLGALILRRWNGSEWTSVGGGLYGGWTARLHEHQGKIIAGGSPSFAIDDQGTKAAYGVASWDSSVSRWSGLPGDVLSFNRYVGKAISIESFDQGVAMASFIYAFKDQPSGVRVVHWTGGVPSESALLGGVFDGPVYALAEHGDSLVAGGYFNGVGGVPMKNVAAWDGVSWSQVGDGSLYGVTSLHSSDGQLFAAGSYTWPVQLDGSRWVPLGETQPGVQFELISSHQGKPIGVQRFYKPGQEVRQVVRRDSNIWSSLGPEYQNIDTLLSWNGDIYACINGSVRRWSDLTWIPVGAPPLGSVSGFAISQGSLVALSSSNLEYQVSRLVNGVWHPISASLPAVQLLSHKISAAGSDIFLTGSYAIPGGTYTSPWARLACSCPSDCDNSGLLDVDDFVCFQTLYAVGDMRADCDGDGALAVEDFVCFQVAYAVGC